MDTATCGTCGQEDIGQTGEYPCPDCGLPTLWDTQDPPQEPGILANLANGYFKEAMVQVAALQSKINAILAASKED